MTNKPTCAWSLADLDNVPSNGVKVMSTFACGGGSSMEYKAASVIDDMPSDFTAKQVARGGVRQAPHIQL